MMLEWKILFDQNIAMAFLKRHQDRKTWNVNNSFLSQT